MKYQNIGAHCLKVRRKLYTTHSGDLHIRVVEYLQVPRAEGRVLRIQLKCYRLGRNNIFRASRGDVPSCSMDDEGRFKSCPFL